MYEGQGEPLAVRGQNDVGARSPLVVARTEAPFFVFWLCSSPWSFQEQEHFAQIATQPTWGKFVSENEWGIRSCVVRRRAWTEWADCVLLARLRRRVRQLV